MKRYDNDEDEQTSHEINNILEIHLRMNQEVKDYNTLLKMEKSILLGDNKLPNEQPLNKISLQLEE